jgi:iron(III) transport system substrate-binding protein
MSHPASSLKSLAAITAASLMLLGTAQASQVNVYSARHYDSDNALFDRFTQETGIRVRVLQGDSDQLVERIRREGVASPADVLITVDAGRLWRAQAAGVLQPVQSAVLEERIPEHLRHPEGYWFGFSQRLRLIYFNRERFDPSTLSRYEELVDPTLRGRICIRSSNNIYNQSLLGSLIEVLGEEGATEWARGLVANLTRPPQGGDTDQIRGVAAGECDVGVANHYYYLRLVNSSNEADRAAAAAVGIIFPNQDDRGVHINIGGAGVVAGAPNRENAIRLLEYLASDAAQENFASVNYEYPAVAGVAPDPAIEAWGELVLDQLGVSSLGVNNPTAVRIADQVGWR